jgi:hypothetical protein
MNIPMMMKLGQEHPTINDTAYHGIDFRVQSKLFFLLREIVHDTKHFFIEQLEDVN